MSRLAGRVTLVTGAAQGIGKGIAKAMVKEDAQVILWDINDLVHETADEISRSGSKVASHNVNVAAPGEVEETLRHILNEFGRIDTPLTKPMAEELNMNQKDFDIWLSKSTPMKRMGKTSELGDLAVFLDSEESAYITGQEIIIDGGNTIQEVKTLS